MKSIPFILLSVFCYQLALAQDHVDMAMDWYNKRTDGAIGYKADPKPISTAIEYFKKAMAEPEKELQAGTYLMRSYIFNGRVVLEDDDAKRKVFEQAKIVGEQLVPKYPNDKELRFENLTAVGLWGERLGIF
jgi:hypothetical protein